MGILLLCIGLTVLSPHVTQVTNRRLVPQIWACPRCTRSEGNDGLHCKTCGGPKPIMPAVWRCSACQFDNDSERTACQMCRTVKEGVHTSSSSAAWRCSRCQFDNGSERTACQMCRYV